MILFSLIWKIIEYRCLRKFKNSCHTFPRTDNSLIDLHVKLCFNVYLYHVHCVDGKTNINNVSINRLFYYYHHLWKGLCQILFVWSGFCCLLHSHSFYELMMLHNVFSPRVPSKTAIITIQMMMKIWQMKLLLLLWCLIFINIFFIKLIKNWNETEQEFSITHDSLIMLLLIRIKW